MFQPMRSFSFLATMHPYTTCSVAHAHLVRFSQQNAFVSCVHFGGSVVLPYFSREVARQVTQPL